MGGLSFDLEGIISPIPFGDEPDWTVQLCKVQCLWERPTCYARISVIDLEVSIMVVIFATATNAINLFMSDTVFGRKLNQ